MNWMPLVGVTILIVYSAGGGGNVTCVPPGMMNGSSLSASSGPPGNGWTIVVRVVPFGAFVFEKLGGPLTVTLETVPCGAATSTLIESVVVVLPGNESVRRSNCT